MENKKLEEEPQKLTIKNWAVEDRPREKLLLKGITALTDAELIAVLIGSGIKNESAVDLAKRILAQSENNLHELGKKDLKQLQSFKGIGQARAISIVAALELGRRRKLSDILAKAKITCSADVYEVFQPLLSDLPHEEFWVLGLSNFNKIIARQKISQGGLSATVVDIKMIIKFALDNLASNLVLCHNHPSGNPEPSNNDKIITTRLIEAAGFFDIKVFDHLIVADSNYFSFADENILF